LKQNDKHFIAGEERFIRIKTGGKSGGGKKEKGSKRGRRISHCGRKGQINWRPTRGGKPRLLKRELKGKRFLDSGIDMSKRRGGRKMGQNEGCQGNANILFVLTRGGMLC